MTFRRIGLYEHYQCCRGLAQQAQAHAVIRRGLRRGFPALAELGQKAITDRAAFGQHCVAALAIPAHRRAADQHVRLAMQPRNRKVRTLLAQAMYRAGDPLDALDTIREIAGRGDAREGAAAMGRLLPFGIGAAVGGGTNWWMARGIAKDATRLFRQLPADLVALPPPPARPAGLPG